MVCACHDSYDVSWSEQRVFFLKPCVSRALCLLRQAQTVACGPALADVAVFAALLVAEPPRPCIDIVTLFATETTSDASIAIKSEHDIQVLLYWILPLLAM